jgi:hypothetical protein
MKVASLLLLLGLMSTTEAREQYSLAQIRNKNSQRMAVLESSSSDSDSDSDNDSLVQVHEPCEYLDET